MSRVHHKFSTNHKKNLKKWYSAGCNHLDSVKDETGAWITDDFTNDDTLPKDLEGEIKCRFLTYVFLV